MSELPTTTNEQGLRVRTSPWFKLRREKGRHFVAVDLVKGFGFIPSMIIVERDQSRSNVMRVNAVLTVEEIEKEDTLLAQREREREKVREALKKDFEKNKKIMEDKAKEVSSHE